MAFLRILLVVLASTLGLGKCAFVDTLNKCTLADKNCQKHLFEKVLRDICKTGVSELDIPRCDPFDLKDLNVSIPDVMDMVLVEGSAKGVRDCVVNKFDPNIETLHASIELTCDLVIKSKYKMQSSSPIIKNLFQGPMHGEGNGKVKIEKLHIKIDFPFEVQKRGDDTFLWGDLKKFKHTFDIKGKVTFAADNIYLGEKESSKEVVPLMNENWKVMVDSFGSHFLDVAINVVYDFLQKFFNHVATKYYIVDDLTPYVKQ